MAMSKPSCDACSRRKPSPVVAKQYCTDCEVNLCTVCLNAHSSFKACSSHNLIDSGSSPIEKLCVQNACTKHDEMTLDFFCVEHDCLCCRSCMAETHINCQKFIPMEVASQGVRKSLMLEEVSDTVANLRGTLETLISNRNENLKGLNDEELDMLRNVSDNKSKMLEHLDDLERKVISELKSLKTKCEKQIKSDKDILSKLMESLDEVTSKLDRVSKHGSENQLFILLNSYKWKLSDYETNIQEIIASMLTSKISLKRSPQQQQEIELLGSVHIEFTPCPIKYKASKSKQAQVLPTAKQAQVLPATIKNATKFKIDFQFKVYSSWITSIAVTDDNRLLLCDRKSTELLVYNDCGVSIFDEDDCTSEDWTHGWTLSGKPWDIAIIPGEDKAVVSLPDRSSIQFVDIQSMKSGSTHSVPGGCYGIAVVGDKIGVGGKGKINILSKQGGQITTITIPDGGVIEYLHPGSQDSVYYTDYTNNTVGCVKLSGEVRFKCTPENFDGPRAVTTDMGGNLYVACKDSNNIHRLSPDGNVIDIILDHDEISKKPYVLAFSTNYQYLFKPCGLAFSTNYRYLFVTEGDGKSVSVFSCSK